MKSILVTGGAGFIGSHTCVKLLQEGFDVCIADSLVNSSEFTITQINKIIKNFHKDKYGKLFFRKGDLRNKNFVQDLFSEFKNKKNPFESVIHFAGLKAVEESINKPLDYWNVNLISTINLLSIMEQNNCNTIVFSSSATIYETAKDRLLKENDQKNPINPYGNTKLAIETLLNDLFNSNPGKWKIANLRYFNPVGAHESGLIGENPLNKPSNLFPLILKVAKGEYEHLSIFGNDWETRDGTCIRDYIHVMDLAEAHFEALNFLKRSKPQILPLNIGTGKGTTVLEVLEAFKKINKCEVFHKIKNRRKGDNCCVVADNNLAKETLGWYPKRGMYEICSDLWKSASLD
ncbi:MULTISPECIES: UDP-glucose 4-epimerase GalE [unclassified Prochlorococcus]|uniref:UDP-glucose 4-epimerase GalE n=1 Tax=unclassified Prochlorococcus TaxID=2627481 RepID=UPI00097CCBBB|nr:MULTISPECIES: UDP-glucose 4-epimerase GalE [unclassified Prochlorococcus]AQL29780.1 UDP-glucose 4-epimerase GalE [Prochlorococcus sp. RS50]AQL31589.1 UDP-glucose 4-epimerase GalE [Prochlorococcus sp. RS01]AQL34541.1 UDP-glucose 4-epimerase GalE [Prochlorococcus sp. RS04]